MLPTSFIEPLEDRRLLSASGLIDCDEPPVTDRSDARSAPLRSAPLRAAAATAGKPDLKGTWFGSRTIFNLNDTLSLRIKITSHKRGSFSGKLTSPDDPSLRGTVSVTFTTTRKFRVDFSGSDDNGSFTGGGSGKYAGGVLSGKMTFRQAGLKFDGSFTFRK